MTTAAGKLAAVFSDETEGGTMNEYQVTAKAVFLKSGTLRLTKEQAASRAHNLRALGGGLFEIINEVCFKAGEKIGYDGNLKALADQLKTPEEIAAEEKAKADADAKAKAAAKAAKGGKGKGDDKAKAEAEAKAKADAGGNAGKGGAGEGTGADPLNAGQ